MKNKIHCDIIRALMQDYINGLFEYDFLEQCCRDLQKVK